ALRVHLPGPRQVAATKQVALMWERYVRGVGVVGAVLLATESERERAAIGDRELERAVHRRVGGLVIAVERGLARAVVLVVPGVELRVVLAQHQHVGAHG